MKEYLARYTAFHEFDSKERKSEWHFPATNSKSAREIASLHLDKIAERNDFGAHLSDVVEIGEWKGMIVLPLHYLSKL